MALSHFLSVAAIYYHTKSEIKINWLTIIQCILMILSHKKICYLILKSILNCIINKEYQQRSD